LANKLLACSAVLGYAFALNLTKFCCELYQTGIGLSNLAHYHCKHKIHLFKSRVVRC
jgi:hypothetical protein